jgi:hypothetical protein
VSPSGALPAAILLLCGLVAAGCHPRLRSPALPYEVAARDRQARTITVQHVWDALRDRPDGTYPRGNITHWIELDVTGPDGAEPEAQTWPYDQDSLGLRPPPSGTTLVVAPAEWLAPPGSLPRRPQGRPGR